MSDFRRRLTFKHAHIDTVHAYIHTHESKQTRADISSHHRWETTAAVQEPGHATNLVCRNAPTLPCVLAAFDITSAAQSPTGSYFEGEGDEQVVEEAMAGEESGLEMGEAGAPVN